MWTGNAYLVSCSKDGVVALKDPRCICIAKLSARARQGQVLGSSNVLILLHFRRTFSISLLRSPGLLNI